ncbi:uncharacterized protein LOC115765868 isoform X5 [Drosophila novamexicana]|uniref:uncharacterized protein LOC115765868 isoform X5 n=1 Tax=Drosophila novamexicana TaxID=47314 RepID=UPI0011E5C2D1|nr:uncharacterized protein LOC115765868 isoform X5 [Drosophila novamexicana]
MDTCTTARVSNKPESRTVSTNGTEVSEECYEDSFEDNEPRAPPSYRSTRSKAYGCCIAKTYYSEYGNLVDSLHITPRLIIQKKAFRKNSTYGLNIAIRNTGLYQRKITITTDSPSDTTIVILQPELNRFIETDKVLNVKINIRSKTSKNINRPRHILIHSFHPNITFQVPIIVLKNMTEPFVCEHITLPPTVPRDRSHYELIMYNPTKDPITVKYRNSFKGIILHTLNKNVIVPHDYLKLLIKFDPKNLQEYKGFFNVKFGVSPPKLVIFKYVPMSMNVYINRGYISFGLNKFGDEIQRTITICNESPHAVLMSTSFYAAPKSEEEIYESESDDISEHSQISDKLLESAISMHSVLLYDFDELRQSGSLSYSESAASHFRLEAPTELESLDSYEIILIFRPVAGEEPFSENKEPPFLQRTKINFCFTDFSECMQSHYIVAEGEIAGIELEVFPKVIDFRKIYLGEEHCAFIKILNVDGVPARVKYKDCLEPEDCGVRVTPLEGFVLEPCDRGIFHVSFFTIVLSRFFVTLRFKVEYGAYYTVTIKGVGQHVQLRTFPQLVEFGSIPFAVPQKRLMLLMNPLAVPITMQVTATDDGSEQPLVFNIRDSTEMLPITIRDPIKHLQQVHEDLRGPNYDVNEKIELSTVEPDMLSEKSLTINESVYSLQFEEDIIEPVPVLATHLLKTLKRQKIFDKSETDKRVIHEALSSLLETNYFSIMKKHNSFIFLDWNAIPSDPNEVYCDNEIIYLRPNTGRSITILVIPNRVGYFHRSLSVRICPATPMDTSESTDEQQLKTLIRSEFLCSKLWFEYNCCTPDITWENCVDLTGRIIYAGEEYSFDMEFWNTSKVGGFIHYDVVPKEMNFRDGNWKFYIGSNSHVVGKCLITFRVLGTNKLSGLLRIVGGPHPYPFHLFANVLPTEICVTPKAVHVRLQVFELNKFHIYIENCSPTITILSMKLNTCLNVHKYYALPPERHRVSASDNARRQVGAHWSEHVHDLGVNVSRSRSIYEHIIYRLAV